jgi:hypothetical protein
MQVATWNLNNREGKIKFRPEADRAAIALGADVLVFNEYYLKNNEFAFSRTLHDAGWSYQEKSLVTGEKANRILISSRLPLQLLDIGLRRLISSFRLTCSASACPRSAFRLSVCECLGTTSATLDWCSMPGIGSRKPLRHFWISRQSCSEISMLD